MPEFDYRDVLLKAASIVEEGWFQGGVGRFIGTNPNGENECALTATNRARVELGVPAEVEYEADDALQRHLDIDSIQEWNDTPGRTADEVADALRRAAE